MHRQHASVVLGVLASVIPVVIGDVVTFLVGRHLLGWLLSTRVGRRLFEPALRERAERIVRRHRWLAVAVGRFLVQLRGPVYLAIGEAGGSVLRFLAVDLPVAILEVSLTFTIGYWFGAQDWVHGRVRGIYLLAALSVLLSVLVPALLRRRWRAS